MAEFSSEPIWDWWSLFWEVITYWLNFFNWHWPIHIVYFFLYVLINCVFQGIDPYHLGYQICEHRSIRSIYFVFFKRPCVSVPCFISEFINLCLFFPLIWLINFIDLSVLLIFQQTDVWFYWFSSTNFLFSI